jgi:cytochrome P450
MDDPGLALLAPTFSADPHPIWHRLRETAPVRRSDALRRWIVTGSDECLATLRGPDLGMGRDQFLAEMFATLGRGRAFDYVSHRLTSYDPPEHHRVRSSVQGAFTGHRPDRLRTRCPRS